MEVSGDSIYVSAAHFCPSDTSSTDYYSCTSLSKYDNEGNLARSLLLDTVTPEGYNRLLISESNILLAGHWRQTISGRPTVLLNFDSQFNIQSVHEYPSDDDLGPNVEGIIEFQNAYYLYGNLLKYNESKSYSHITKIDKHTEDIIWEREYSRAAWKNECFDLQPTIDSNLIYIHNFNDNVGAGGESGFQIMKIDTIGNSIDSFEFEDIGIDNPRLLASREGDIYFTSQDPPYPHTIPTNGRINKINASLDDLKWSLELPSNPFIDAHRYKIYDYIQAASGDIVACGTVWEEGPDGPLLTPNNHTWNGFIVRVDQGGKLKWLHIYRHPNRNPSLPHDEFGEFIPSELTKMHEMENGHFMAGGTVYYNGDQSSVLPFTENQSWIWLMNVDENGCMEGEECTEVIVIDSLKVGISILQNQKTEIKVFPNPFHDFMIVDIQNAISEVRVELFDVNGKLLDNQAKNLNGFNAFTFDLSTKPSGIYFYHVIYSGKIVTGKVVKR